MQRAWCWAACWAVVAWASLLATSLYLPWRATTCDGVCTRDRTLFEFSGAFGTVDGWASGSGDVTILAALALVALALAAITRRAAADRLVFGTVAVAACYFAVAIAAQTGVAGRTPFGRAEGVETHFAYGAYLGLAAGCALGVFGAAFLWSAARRRWSAVNVLATGLSVAVLVSFLLPWESLGPYSMLGIERASAVVGAAAAVSTPVLWAKCSARVRAGHAVGLLVLTLATTLRGPGSEGHRAYGAWVGVSAAIALAGVGAAVAARSGVRWPRWPKVVLPLAGALFIASLFLPWQGACSSGGGVCMTWNGWSTDIGSAAALCAALLVLARPAFVSAVESAVVLVICASTVGIAPVVSGGELRLAYGAAVGLSAAAALIALRVRRDGRRPSPRIDRTFAPLAVCAAYVAVTVLPWWRVLPARLDSVLAFTFPTWLGIVGIVLAVHLAALWSRRSRSRRAIGYSLVFLPLGMLVLFLVEAVRVRNGLAWGAGITGGICFVLVLFGWAEQHDHLKSLRVPEILRIDRI